MIDLTDAKAHLNLTTDDDDRLVNAKIDAATAWIALYTGTDYVTPGEDADGYPVPVDTTPAPVKEACRQLTAHLYQNREASLVGVTAQALPFGLLDLLAPYRAWSF